MEDLSAAVNSIFHSADKEEAKLFIDLAACCVSGRVLSNLFPGEVDLFIKTIRDHPELLRDAGVCNIFIDLFEFSKRSNTNKKAMAIRKSFRNHFVLQENRIKARDREIVEGLMKKLAAHFKKICENNSEKILIKAVNMNGRRLDNKNGRTHKKLLEWAIKNNELRIAALLQNDNNQDALSMMLYNPSTHINSLLEAGFYKSSKRLPSAYSTR